MPTAPAQDRPAGSPQPRGGQALLAAFSGPIRPVRPSVFYLAWLFITACAMLLLPLLYLAIIAAAGYAVYYHARYHFDVVPTGTGGRVQVIAFFFVYVAPLIIGVIAVLFMIKPLLARPARRDMPLTLDRSQEPLLYAFIERLCEVIGAPFPREIEVDCSINAGAGLINGMWGLFRRRLGLSIGLPLVAGLDVRQFAGVLAHELGHFTQGVGMRLSYVIRRINGWFARVVYERDAWDQQLVDACENQDSRIGIIFYVARAVVWLTRQILKLLMYAGHGISSFMSRQMEYNADRHEAAVSGTAAFAQTVERLRVLNITWEILIGELQFIWREKRLPDNLPLFLHHRADQSAPKLKPIVEKMITGGRTGFFSSHPSDAARIAHVNRFETPGVFSGSGPAQSLFSNFTMIANAVTLSFYRDGVGLAVEQQNLVPSHQLVKEQDHLSRQFGAMARFFQHCITLTRPLSLPAEPISAPANAKDAIARLKAARQKFDNYAARFRPLYDQHRKLIEQKASLFAAHAMLRAGAKLDARSWGADAATKATAEAGLNRLSRELLEVGDKLAALDAVQSDRLMTALSLARIEAVRQRLKLPDAHFDRIDALSGVLRKLWGYHAQLNALTEHTEALKALLNFACERKGELEPFPLFEAVVKGLTEKAHIILQNFWGDFQITPYPFQFAGEEASVSTFAIGRLPPPKDVVATTECAMGAVEKLKTCASQCLSALADVAERVERVIGLGQLPEPRPLHEAEDKVKSESAA